MRFVIFIIILFICKFAHAENQKYQVVASLEDSWVVYDEKYSAYVPYIEKVHSNIKTISQTLNYPKYERFSLSFYGIENLCIFIDHRLYFIADKNKRYTFNIDSIISRIIPKKRNVFISFWQPDGDLPFKRIYKVLPKTNHDYKNTTTAATAIVVPQEKSLLNNYFIIVVLLLCAVYALLKSRYLNTFQSFHNIKNIFSPLNIDANLLLKPLSGVNLFFILAFCFLLSFVLQSIEYLPAQTGKNGIMTLSGIINPHGPTYLFPLKLPVDAIFIFLLLIIKYCLLLIVSWLLKCRQFIKYHYLDTMSIIQIFGLIFLPIVALLVHKHIVGEAFISNLIFYILIFILCFTLLRTIILLNKLTSFRNLNFFSYICATELIPSIVLVKVLL